MRCSGFSWVVLLPVILGLAGCVRTEPTSTDAGEDAATEGEGANPGPDAADGGGTGDASAARDASRTQGDRDARAADAAMREQDASAVEHDASASAEDAASAALDASEALDAGTDAALAEDAGNDASVEPGVLTTYDYYVKSGTELHWVSAAASGKLTTLSAPLQRAFMFPEAELDGAGVASARRTSVVYLSGGMLYRLEGQAIGKAPKPVQVSSMSGISDICYAWVSSNLQDRTQSRLFFQYNTTGTCVSFSPHSGRPTASVRLLAPADELPTTSLYPRATPLIDRQGHVEDVLSVALNNQLERHLSMADPTAAAVLIDATSPVWGPIGVTALGGSRYLLSLSRNDSSAELFIYDASTHTLGVSLGRYAHFVGGALGDPLGLAQSDTHVFFVAKAKAAIYYQIYRVARDGASAPEALADITDTGSLGLRGLAVTNGRLVFARSNPSGIYSVPLNDDFAAPTITTLVAQSWALLLVSDTRVFYQQGNLAGAMDLDGAHAQVYSPNGVLSHWSGCTREASLDRPGALVAQGNCARVYMHVLGADLRAGTIESFAPDVEPGTPLFSSALLDQQTHGTLPDELVSWPLLMDARDWSTYTHAVSLTTPLAGTLGMQSVVNGPERPGLFWLSTGGVQPSVSVVDSEGAALRWVSRGR